MEDAGILAPQDEYAQQQLFFILLIHFIKLKEVPCEPFVQASLISPSPLGKTAVHL
jgi:hypothetical protein